MKSMDNYDLQVDIARKIFLSYDQALLRQKFSLEADDTYLYLTYLNTPCRLARATGTLEEYKENSWQECRDYSRVMTVYDLLCHHKGAKMPELSGQWCTVGTFIVTGITETEGFTRKVAEHFNGCLEELRKACQNLGGSLQPPMAGADLTCLFWATPFFPVLLQFWEGDDEFPPKLLILWDRNTDRFMHFETTFYLQGDVLSRLKRCMEENI